MSKSNTSASVSPTGSPLSIEQLQSKYDELNHKKIEADTRHRLTLEELEKLRTQAMAMWGTDDIEELKLKLVQMQHENEERRAKYQSQLESIESELAEIETQHRLAQDQA